MCMSCQDGGYAPFHLPKKHQLGASAGSGADGYFEDFAPLDPIALPFVKPVYTLEESVEALRGWGETADGTMRTRTWHTDTIFYSIPTDFSSPDTFSGVEGIGFQPMSMPRHNMAVAAFELWDDLIDVNMVETTEISGDVITMAYSTETELNAAGRPGTYAKTYVTPGTGPDFTIDHANIWLASSWASLDEDSDIYFGSYGFGTYIHEIGHTLGLTHPSSYDAGRERDIRYASHAEYVQDTVQYSVMSYFGGWQDTDGDGTWTFTTAPDPSFRTRIPSTPMLHDVAAIQESYGADLRTREGDTTYGFHSTADRRVFNFDVNRDPILTIWDGAGTDTLDVSGFGQNQVIDLNPGTYSSVGRLVDNVAIAFDCWIENAVGGSGNDRISGNRKDNVLSGGDGIDTISGGEGNDTLDGGAGADIMRGDRGNDIYVVDLLSDSVIETTGGGIDKVIAQVWNYMLPSHVENGEIGVETGLMLRGNELANTLTGNIGDDILLGGELGDTLDGGRGNDHLNGGTGADIMRGGLGDDTYYLDALTDQVREEAMAGTDTVLVQVSNYVLPVYVERGTVNTAAGLTLSGNGADNVLTGNAGMDTLNGGGSSDELHGADNADRLNGGAGKDILFGDAGMDTFVFRRGEASADTVIDFDGLGALSGDRFEFQGYGPGASFFRLDPTHWMINSGDGLVHETITLANAAAVHWSDFAFIG